MKKVIKYFLYSLISVYILYFISGCCDFCYQAWDSSVWAHQKYQMDSMSLDSFKARYMKFSQKKEVKKIYCSPYNHDTDSVEFIFICQDRQGLIHCSYFSNELNALMSFFVEDKKPLEICFYGILSSCESKVSINAPLDYAWRINDGSKTWGENNKYLKAFENEVLKNIGNYQKDCLQGFLCWYSYFFTYHFSYILLLGVFLALLFAAYRKWERFSL